jgi:hypothetical protein
MRIPLVCERVHNESAITIINRDADFFGPPAPNFEKEEGAGLLTCCCHCSLAVITGGVICVALLLFDSVMNSTAHLCGNYGGHSVSLAVNPRTAEANRIAVNVVNSCRLNNAEQSHAHVLAALDHY